MGINYGSVQARMTWKKWLAFLVLSQGILALMTVWTFPYISSQARGLAAFDMKPFGYSVDEARVFLCAISQAGNTFYTNVQLPLDIAYPLFLCLLYESSLIILYRVATGGNATAAARPRGYLLLLLALPVIGMLDDYAENVCVFLMLSRPPAASEALIKTANVFTLVKSVSTTVNWSVLLVFGIVALVAIIRKQRDVWKRNSR